MGSNTSSLSQKPKKEQTKMEKVRAALRSALNKSTVDKNGNKKYKSTDGTWTVSRNGPVTLTRGR